MSVFNDQSKFELMINMPDRDLSLAVYIALLILCTALVVLFITYTLVYRLLAKKNEAQTLLQDAKNSIFNVRFPGLLCFILGTGINCLSRSTIIGILRVLNIIGSAENPEELGVEITIGLIATVSGAVVETGLYLALKGDFSLPLILAGSLSTLIVNFLHAMYDNSTIVNGIWTTALLCCHVITSWLCTKSFSALEAPVSKEISDSHPRNIKKALFRGTRKLLIELAIGAFIVFRQTTLRDRYLHQHQYLPNLFQTTSYLLLLISVSAITIEALTEQIEDQGRLNWPWKFTLETIFFPLYFYLTIAKTMNPLRWNEMLSGIYVEIFKFFAVGFLSATLSMLWLYK